ncbi:porin [Vibrio sp. TRT 17S01]|uniref:porin n=1 Tax=Vibrio sp. TRT 17S01 TaxID=3418505 RepID=UPI003CF76B46
MMKKTCLSIAIALTCFTQAQAYELINTDQAYLTVYGNIKAQAQLMDERDNNYTFGDSSIGVDGQYFITDTLAIAAGTEAQVNLDADEDRNEDDLYLSQYYVGLYSESLGKLTYGKHSTSSDNFGGVDYSEGFGGEANLNSVGVKDETIKYQYSTELFALSSTYGFESGDRKRELAELFGSYRSADITLVAGIGKTKTNADNNKQESIYGHTSAFLEMGDYNLGATYYYNSTEDKLVSSRSVDKNALAFAGQLAFVEGVTLYSGYEVVFQDSDTESENGVLHNAYTGLTYRIFDQAKLFSEVGYVDPISKPSEVNLSLGATLSF